MVQPNLGTKRQCPKCSAKFYDFGATDPITCPKCGKTWREDAVKPRKIKKESSAPKRVLEDDLDALGMPNIEDGGAIEEIEPIDDEDVEMTSLQEVEEHEEAEENDVNSDDAEDDMFTDLSGDNKLVDDLEDHIETDDDEEDDEDSDDDDEEDDDDDDDDDDDTKKPKKRRR